MVTPPPGSQHQRTQEALPLGTQESKACPQSQLLSQQSEVLSHTGQGTHPECSPHRQAPVSLNPPWSGHGGCSSPRVGCQPRPFAGLGKSDRAGGALRHSPLPTQESGHSSVHVRTSRGILAFLGSTGARVRKKPLQLGGLEWGGLAFHCWKHRLGVRLVWASQDQELGETSCPLS